MRFVTVPLLCLLFVGCYESTLAEGSPGVRDGGAPDSGGRDSGVRDGGARDTGGRDSGGRDAGGRDSGGRDTAPACIDTETPVVGLSCPASAALGVRFRVEVEVSGPCCGELLPEVEVVSTGESAELLTKGMGCDCCLDCDCEGRASTSVSLVAEREGVFTVRADGASCEVRVLPPDCIPAEPDQVLVPRYVMQGQDIPITVQRTNAPGCGCEPVFVGDERDLSLALCGCCMDCDCASESYRSTLVLPSRPPGDFTVHVEGRDYEVGVRRPDACNLVTAEGVGSPLPAPPNLVETDPSAVWVSARADELRCCFDPAPVLVPSPPPPGYSHAFQLYDCERDCGCDCGPDGRRCTRWPVEARYPVLGERVTRIRIDALEALP